MAHRAAVVLHGWGGCVLLPWARGLQELLESIEAADDAFALEAVKTGFRHRLELPKMLFRWSAPRLLLTVLALPVEPFLREPGRAWQFFALFPCFEGAGLVVAGFGRCSV